MRLSWVKGLSNPADYQYEAGVADQDCGAGVTERGG